MRHLTAIALISVAVAGLLGCSTDNPGPPAEYSIALSPTFSGDGQNGEVDTQLSSKLRVLVLLNGLPAPGVEVQWVAAAGAGVVAPATDLTDDTGLSEVQWTMPTASGNWTATAALSGATGSPVTFHATAVAGAPTSFTIRGGNNQTTPAGTPVGEPLGVATEDTYGNPVEGSTVTWVVLSGSATLSASTSESTASGIATIDVTAGPTPGPVVIRAISDASLPSVDFQLTVSP
jgi:hypothetical protein